MSSEPNATVGSFKELKSDIDVSDRRSTLNQLVDVIQEDIYGPATRRKYQVFVTGGIGPGVTSSLFQTVHDQDFTLQTSNPIFDMTVGLFRESDIVKTKTVDGGPLQEENTATGMMIFAETSLMMREKVDIYRQYAANLLGSASLPFSAPYGSSLADDRIDAALFLSFKRLFARDRMKRETLALRIFEETGIDNNNLEVGDFTGTAKIITDFGAATNLETSFGGEVGNIVDANNTDTKLGLIFYDHGTIVLDMEKIFNWDQQIQGQISSVAASTDPSTGKIVLNNTLRFLTTSGSIDEIVDHVSKTRFGDATSTAITFQNITNINSTLIFCRATADEFNYSTNPTFTDSNGRIQVIDPDQEDFQRSFTFVTTVGLYDETNNLLAVAKLSRPIEKNDEKDLTIRVRLDF